MISSTTSAGGKAGALDHAYSKVKLLTRGTNDPTDVADDDITDLLLPLPPFRRLVLRDLNVSQSEPQCQQEQRPQSGCQGESTKVAQDEHPEKTQEQRPKYKLRHAIRIKRQRIQVFFYWIGA
mmetsp:Transcript_31443/g.47461  ORF Transcript_31443/g.47461 Transcript_31443/m.47461 type:complete len:123 (+) Transcript_31443:116-484(+)